MYFGLLFIVLWILLLVWVIRAGFGRGTGPVFKGMNEQAGRAVCGVCGYAVVLGDAERCAECGTRYDRGGIVTRAMAVRLGPPLWVIVIAMLPIAGALSTALVPLATGIISRFEHRVLKAFSEKYDYNASPTFGPDSSRRSARPDYRFSISHDVITDGGVSSAPLSGVIAMGVEGTAVTLHTAEYDVEEGEWILRDGAGKEIERGTALEAAAEALYRHSGADELWEGSEAELADARQIAKLALTNARLDRAYMAGSTFEEHGLGGLSGGGGRSSIGGGSSAGYVGVMVAQGVALTVPVIAAVVIYRARRRVLQAQPSA